MEQPSLSPMSSRPPRRSCLGWAIGALVWLFVVLFVLACGVLASFLLSPPFGEATTVRILMVGLDEAEMPGEARRSDSIILGAVRLNGGGVTLLSVPRDARVTIPHHGIAKINAATPTANYPC